MESLRKLLAVKRYESPPPGYFATFSAKVIARIEAGESVNALPWWRRFLLTLAARPSLASGFALIVGLSVLGAIGVAPAVRSGDLEGDLMLGSAPVAIQAALGGWSERGATPAPETYYLEASSVAPVLARQTGPFEGFVLRPASLSVAH